MVYIILQGVNVRMTYDRNNYEFAVSKQVGMPDNFQHVMTSVTLSKKKNCINILYYSVSDKKYIIYM